MAMLPPDPVYIFKREMLSISCLAFRITNVIQKIYAGTQSGIVHVWDLKSKREIGTLKAGDTTCLSVCIPEEVELVITHSKSGDLSFWNEHCNEWTLKKLVKIDYFGFCKCQLFGDFLWAPIKDSNFELISVGKMERLDTVSLKDGNLGDIMAFKVCHISHRKTMIVAHEGLELALWDLEELKKSSSLKLNECPMSLDYDVETNKGVCGSSGDKILVFSLDQNFELKVERSVAMKNAGVAAVRIRPDRKLVAVGCWDGKVRLYSWKSFVLLAALDIHSATVQDVCFGENRKGNSKVKYLLAAGSRDSTISLWDLYN